MGNIRLTGRVDGVMKVAGHRLSTAELENARTSHEAVVECVPVAFVTLREGINPSEQLTKDLAKRVDAMIVPTARPNKIVYANTLPKTRSWKNHAKNPKVSGEKRTHRGHYDVHESGVR